jgi:lysine-specific demethylase/histidyl-hydroxylase NO66
MSTFEHSNLHGLESYKMRDWMDLTAKAAQSVRTYENGARTSGDASTQFDNVNKDYISDTTILVPSAHRFDQAIADVTNEIASRFKVSLFCNLYLSWPNAKTFPRHYDGHDVFALQITGRKQWRVFAPVSDFSPKGSLVFNATRFLQDYVIAPPTVLYLRKGMVHEVIALDAFSAHLTLGVRE